MKNMDQDLTKVQEFRHILLVHDLFAERKFYEEIFNWPVKEDWGGGILYDTGGAIFELIQEPKAPKPNASSRIAIKVTNVWELYERLKDKVTIEHEIRDNSWGDTAFRFVDPEGFPITVFTPTSLKGQS